MDNPPFTWTICQGELRMWRGKQFLGAIPRDLFPDMIVRMAKELGQPRVDGDDPGVPLG